jgi:DNA-binding NarL/FixJ family response regulator
MDMDVAALELAGAPKPTLNGPNGGQARCDLCSVVSSIVVLRLMLAEDAWKLRLAGIDVSTSYDALFSATGAFGQTTTSPRHRNDHVRRMSFRPLRWSLHDDRTRIATKQTIPVWLIEPHPLAARHLGLILKSNPLFRVDSYDAQSDRINPRRASSSVLVIDKDTAVGSLEAHLEFLRPRFVEMRILVIGPSIGEQELFRLLMSGIHGFVSYDDAPKKLSSAIKTIWHGRLWVKPEELERFATYASTLESQKHKTRSKLTPREKLVFNFLHREISNKEIATKLDIAERTVRFHLSNIFAKLGVHDRHSAMQLAGSLIQAVQHQT